MNAPAGDAPRSFFDQTPDSLAEFTTEHDLPPFLGRQLLDWVYDKGVTDLAAMTNLSRRDRERLGALLTFEQSVVRRHQLATDGTQKVLLEWISPNDPLADPLALAPERRETETVMIPTDARRTACLSSQVGCPVGCTFCASGLEGLDGNLTAGMIVEQVHQLRRVTGTARLTNVVFMGMGEPLANYAAVTGAIRTLNAAWGYGVGARKITVSTVGLPTAIRRLANFELPVTLALSLHAPNDELRRRLIPWAAYATIDELVDACHDFFQTAGREVTFEYLLMRDVNDRPTHARELARLARRLRANVNLIRYNEVRGIEFERPASADVHEFQAILRRAGIKAHIRASRGRDIAAACGQLRAEHRQASDGDAAGVNPASTP